MFINDIIFRGEIERDLYLKEIPAVKSLTEQGHLEITGDVTFIVGENGTGKSTLLEGIAVACGFNPEGGTKNFSFSTDDTHSELWQHLTISKIGYPKDGFFLRAESFYNAISYIDELDRQPCGSPRIAESYGGKSLHHRSHGEAFLALVQNRFGGNGLYILDEPEAALSPTRLLTLISEIHRLVKLNSQFIICTHSPILTAFPNADILELSGEGIRRVPYKQTENYLVTKQFLDCPERMLSILLE